MKNKEKFLIFGVLQTITLGLIIFFVLQGTSTIGFDTQLMLSILFPVFTLAIEYMIYTK